MKPRWWIVSVVQDTRLSADERALLIFLGTRPAGWRYSVEECRRYIGFGRNKHFAAMNALDEVGYIVRDYKRDSRGRIKFTSVLVMDRALPKSPKQGLGKASPESPFTGLRTESPKQGQTSLKNYRAGSDSKRRMSEKGSDLVERIDPPRPLRLVGGWE